MEVFRRGEEFRNAGWSVGSEGRADEKSKAEDWGVDSHGRTEGYLIFMRTQR